MADLINVAEGMAPVDATETVSSIWFNLGNASRVRASVWTDVALSAVTLEQSDTGLDDDVHWSTPGTIETPGGGSAVAFDVARVWQFARLTVVNGAFDQTVLKAYLYGAEEV